MLEKPMKNERAITPGKGHDGRVLRLVRVRPRVVSEGLVALKRCQVTCPACGQQVEAVARDGQVKGYCTVAEQYVDFSITPEIAAPIGSAAGTAGIRAKISAAMKKRWQDPEYRANQIDTHAGKHPMAETKAKISAAMKKRQDPEYRAKQIDTDSHFTAEHKAKISAALIRYNTKRRGLITPEIAAPMGSQGTADTGAKISVGHTSKHRTAETRAKISATKKGQHLTAETRAKISATTKGKHLTAEHKSGSSGSVQIHDRRSE